MASDLTGNQDVTFRLLSDLTAWRVRAIESIKLSSALWADRNRSIHVEPIWPRLRDIISADETVRLILPIGSFPKTLRIDLEVIVDGKPVHILPRKELGEWQSRYLKHLADQIRKPPSEDEVQPPSEDEVLGKHLEPGLLMDFLPYLFGFSPGQWRHTIERMGYTGGQPDLNRVLKDYLKHCHAEVEDPIGDDLLSAWGESYLSDIASKVTDRISSWVESATENPLLAVPPAWEKLGSVQNVGAVLNELHSFLKLAEQVVPSEPDRLGPARRLLEAYADYGRHWDALADCVVPLKRPFIIQTYEKRALYFQPGPFEVKASDAVKVGKLTRFKQSLRLYDPREPVAVRQLIVFNDAKSNHIDIRVPDDNIEFERREGIYDGNIYPERREDSHPPPDDVVETSELFSYYSSQKHRTNRLWFIHGLRQTDSRRVTLGFVLAALTTVFLLSIALPLCGFHPQTYTALLLIPSTVAVSLVLTRVNTALGMRVNFRWHAAIALGFFAAWATGLGFACSAKPIPQTTTPPTTIHVTTRVTVTRNPPPVPPVTPPMIRESGHISHRP